MNFNKGVRSKTLVSFKYKYKFFGFNYDDPAVLVNQNEFRFVVGISI